LKHTISASYWSFTFATLLKAFVDYSNSAFTLYSRRSWDYNLAKLLSF
jgi:hypothetical protein